MTSYNNPLMANNNFFCHKKLKVRVQKRANERGETLSDGYRSLIAIALAFEGCNFSRKARKQVEELAVRIRDGEVV